LPDLATLKSERNNAIEKGGIISNKYFILPTSYSPLRGGGFVQIILLEGYTELLENISLVRVVSTPAPYSGSTGFKSQHENGLWWLRFLLSLLSFSTQMPG
jgi:hypothetical protein